jgi:alkylation response protein AidB-like acyl-CoA dehydrogenase
VSQPYRPPLQTTQFLLHEVLKAHQSLSSLDRFSNTDPALMDQILEEASKFVEFQISPLNEMGDRTGCVWKGGQVSTPPGFKEAYQSFWQSGWASLTTQEEDGGQALPALLEFILYEWLSAANHGWTMAPGLLHGAYECIRHHASEELKATYLEKIGTGEWLATMCLTEPQAGSDLGLVSTKARACPDGSYEITGTKIFISGGEHDLSENIVHLVLARVTGAQEGSRGLSLFLVPKFYPDGQRSAVYCERIEEKMGIHASPTCVMRFEDAKAWLVGNENQGLKAMFIMMNAARLHVALQGVGLLDSSLQKAHAYAQERRQMRAPKARIKASEHGGHKNTAEKADLIIEHPQIQRTLLSQNAWVQGMRILAYKTAIHLDLAAYSADPDLRERAQRWCTMITPILKSACTESGFLGSSECLQVFGGHGYIKEWGIEQNVRDARIAMIYEGTNEIQAIDLLLRKIASDSGMQLSLMMDELMDQLPSTHPSTPSVLRLFERIKTLTHQLMQNKEQASFQYQLSLIASDYLRLLSLALMSWSWSQIERALSERQEEAGGQEFTSFMVKSSVAFKTFILPQTESLISLIEHVHSQQLPLSEALTME